MSKAGEELQGARGHPSPQVPISARVAPSQGLLVTLLQLAGGWTRGQHRSRSFVTITVIAITTITMSGLLGRERCYRACLPWHSRLEHCAGFHQSPLWQWQMLQSSTFTSMPAGIIVVPAKQLGPVETHEGDRINTLCLDWGQQLCSKPGTGRHPAPAPCRALATPPPLPKSAAKLPPCSVPSLGPSAIPSLIFWLPSGTKGKKKGLETFLSVSAPSP